MFNSSVGVAIICLTVDSDKHIVPVLCCLWEVREQDAIDECEGSTADVVMSIVLVHIPHSHFRVGRELVNVSVVLAQ